MKSDDELLEYVNGLREPLDRFTSFVAVLIILFVLLMGILIGRNQNPLPYCNEDEVITFDVDTGSRTNFRCIPLDILIEQSNN